MNILAFDVGTSSVKAAVLNVETAEPVSEIARVAYSLDSPTPEAAELPAARLWQAVSQAAKEAVQGSRICKGSRIRKNAGKRRSPRILANAATKDDVAADDVAAIGVSCLMPALVLLDSQDKPLFPIWFHLDRRARPAARAVWAEVGEEFLATVGNRPLPGGISALCFRQMNSNQRGIAGQVRSYLHANGWLALHMTGERAFDRGNACFTGLFDTLGNQEWSPRWCDYFGVDPKWLPPVVCGSTTLGGLRAEIAAEWSLPAGIPVKIGTADTSSAMLAADMKPGDLLHVVGTTQVLAVLTDKPIPSPRRLTRLLGVGKSFIHVTHNPVGGVALDWIRHLSFREMSEQEFYQAAVPLARQRKSPVMLEPPFLGGDRLEIEPCRASFREVDLTTDRLDLLAALLEAMTRGHRQAVAALGQGSDFRRVILTGGGAEVVRGLIPEYSIVPVESLHEGSLRGVARLFAV